MARLLCAYVYVRVFVGGRDVRGEDGGFQSMVVRLAGE